MSDYSEPLDRQLPPHTETLKEVQGELDALLRVGLSAADNFRAHQARKREREDRATANAIKAETLRNAQEAARRLGTDQASLGDMLALSSGPTAWPDGRSPSAPANPLPEQGLAPTADKTAAFER